MKCIILSGVSGSGKSRFIEDFDKKYPKSSQVFSADTFFMIDGEYRFDPKNLSRAHGNCLRNFIFACVLWWDAKLDPRMGNPPTLLVDNTNTTVEEIAPYYQTAKAFGYEVELVTLKIDQRLAAMRSAHSVPERSVQAMHKKLSERVIPHYWDLIQTNYSWDALTQSYKVV